MSALTPVELTSPDGDHRLPGSAHAWLAATSSLRGRRGAGMDGRSRQSAYVGEQVVLGVVGEVVGLDDG